MAKIIQNIDRVRQLFAGGTGLEIGGPSRLFSDEGAVPIYRTLDGRLDGCNFSESTIWQGEIVQGDQYNYYHGKHGTQYVSDATDLAQIADGSYDFLLASHCLEHIANPLKAMKEWMRVVKKGGLIMLALPNRKRCFDHRRPVTVLSHLVEDMQNNTGEDDLTHLEEILRLHDLKKDRGGGTPEQFRERSLNNFENRALHQHVFDDRLLSQIAEYLGLETVYANDRRDHLIIVRKPAE